MNELAKWLAETGTNDWLTAVWKNNWIILTIVFAPIGALLKGKAPEFWEKLLTALPFRGKES